ncbi:universal stress protein [Roseibium sp.]|uniref:universal stress protein n=1 Tax=Roseibium sp. TaxID=1936156 RepID=UPI003A96F2E5
MGYEDILVNVPLVGNSHQVDLALNIAKKFNAHATGICVLPEAAILRDAVQSPFILMNEEEASETIRREYEKVADLEKQFSAAAEQAGVSHNWRSGEGDPAEVLLLATRLHDLVIVGQSGNEQDLLWGAATQLALSGTPTLILPAGWSRTELPQRVLLAWNGSAQAAAAARNALPLLKTASTVTLLIGQNREAPPERARLTPVSIEKYLSRHGVNVEIADLAGRDSDAGAGILGYTETLKPDMIVMGAYGRSRFREWVLGGATRQVLEDMKVPVFMAH